VFVGSPGTSVDDADDLHLDGPVGANVQHVFASTAPHDPIALVSGIDGVDPTDPSYGATTFTSDGKAGPWYTLGWNVDAHSGYWGTRNKALKLMGGIIAGKGTHLP
jgi:hypothetical protein